ncbi:aspartyl protease APCB1 isoform X1 [Cryptomeria japonica]|uniref:aspartyl protease APCB1 isoform X1 n=1 Tax=Cryptomeria japonica TaxID=3369 RepID=UPI0027DA2E00|nr:aspartyl protease APCB1 isoform X1 [Cryptomeria japonica]XP_057832416.2 aspartyl protease APCB1 isoform X1 [Cryptomeria japonica]
MGNMEMRVIKRLFFLLAVVSLGEADVYPIYPKNEQSQISSVVEQDIQRIGRKFQAAVKTTVFKVEGNVFPDGIYYMIAYIGSPPKEYYLDIDTGSDLTWLQCDAPCRSCGKTPHQWYKPRSRSGVSCTHPLCEPVQKASHKKYECKSSSEQCDYDIRYADKGSSLGILIRDSFTVRLTNGTIVRTDSVFGCGYHQYGSLEGKQATDGVLGLSSGIASLPSQWEKQGLIKNVIGLCIAGGGKRGGYMFFGDDHVPTSSMTWVPLLRGPKLRYYHVGPAQMIYGGKPLAKDGDEKSLGGIIFDSGSTYTYFTKKAYGALVSAIKESLGDQLVQDSSDITLPVCWRGEKRFRSIADVTLYFKPLTFNFEEANLEITPEGYLIINTKGNVCLGILDGTDISPYNVIGDISLQGYLVVHDNVNHQIGWTRRACMKFSKSGRLQALEDPQQLPAQDLGSGVCPRTYYFVPDTWQRAQIIASDEQEL